ncbi:unnamed protein product [Anisakis simplex]|uniref:Ezrin n=1 Tax=Anisakis simplex TaxID=6269 RepID=A0A0M3JKX4_ANISI|nr:unnamed protein product [Anisakis simplex]
MKVNNQLELDRLKAELSNLEAKYQNELDDERDQFNQARKRRLEAAILTPKMASNQPEGTLQRGQKGPGDVEVLPSQ